MPSHEREEPSFATRSSDAGRPTACAIRDANVAMDRGLNGKSAFEPMFPSGYLWGAYRRGRSALYTTSGYGHWYPFRLGCPTEAPLLELARA